MRVAGLAPDLGLSFTEYGCLRAMGTADSRNYDMGFEALHPREYRGTAPG